MIIAATGHRPDKLGGHDNSVAENKLRLIAHDYLLKPRAEAFRISGVITGMALGWDQRVAEAALMAHIPFVAAIPFAGQEKKWPARAQKIYHELLTQAHGTYVCSEGGYDPAKMHTRNEWMVDHSDAVMALWNGDETGGTAACVRYAQSKQKPIDNLWDTWLTFEPVPAR